MRSMFKFVLKHKIIVTVLLLALAGGGYYAYKKATVAPAVTRYVLAAAQKGSVIVTVSGTGQVAASNQMDIKPKVSGDIVSVNVADDQRVKAGTVIVRIDSTDAQKSVRDAEASLASAQLSLDKLKEPADALSVLQARNAVDQAKESKQNAQDDLPKTYDDGYTAVANAFVDLPAVMSGLYDTLYGNTASKGVQANLDYYSDSAATYDEKARQYRDDADSAYQTARAKYDQNFDDYKVSSRYSDAATVEALIDETYDTSKSIAEAVKDAGNLIQFYEDKLTEHNLKPVSQADTSLTDLSDYTSKTNSNLNSLLSIKQTISSDKQTLTDADRSIAEKQASLDKLLAPPDPLDIQSQELAVQQRRNALQDVREQLPYYTVTAPFDGIISALNIQKGSPVSSGTVLATIVTQQQLATISLNEVDAAKVQVGQKATLTFDAVPDLSIAGQVSEVDTVGAVSQGVVTYSINIAFDTQDSRVKPGMSLTAAIITASKIDVLTVPNAAVKTSGNGSYVQMLDDAVEVQTASANTNSSRSSASTSYTSVAGPRQQAVETGLADDTNTEITSGLKEGDMVVTSTVKSSTSASSSSTTSASTSRTTSSRGVFGVFGGGPRD